MNVGPIKTLLEFDSRRFSSWHNRAILIFWISSFASLFALWWLNPGLIFPFEALIYYIFIIFIFLVFIKKEFLALYKLPWKIFLNKVFIHSFIYYSLFVIIQYALTSFYAPHYWPFELSAVDSINYDIQSKKIAENFFSLNSKNINIAYSDSGFPYYQGFIYLLIGNYTLPIRLLNCVWAALTVVYLSKMLFILKKDSIAKLCGILVMFMPSIGWMAGMQLKESLMIFLVIYSFYNTIYINNYGISFKRVFLLLCTIILLFFFRTFLGLLVIVSCFTTFYITSFRNFWRNAIVLFIVLPFLTFFIVRIGILSEIESSHSTYSSSETGAYFERGAKRIKRNANSVNLSLLTASSVFMPLSNFYDLDSKDEPETIRVCYRAPNEFIKNTLLFFFFLGLWYSLKNWRTFFPFISFIILYSIIIGTTGAVLNYRYQLVILPFICIFIAYGIIEIYQHRKKYQNYWAIYMFLLVIAHIFYNLSRITFRN